MADAIFKELPLRICGYGFAIGESITYICETRRRVVDMCYLVGTGYCCIHCIYAILMPDGGLIKSFFKAVVWQTCASFLFPTLCSFHIARLTRNMLWDMKVNYQIKRWLPCILGLIILPGLMEPMDAFWEETVTGLADALPLPDS